MANRLTNMISLNSRRYGDREAYRFCWRKGGEWLSTSWADFATQIDVAARAFAAMGLKEQERIAICSPNTPQVLISEFGGYRNRLTGIPIYSGSSQEQFDYIVTNGEAKVIFVGDRHQYPLAYNYWKANPDKVLRVIVFKNDGLELNPDDHITILWDDFLRIGMSASPEIKEIVRERTEAGVPEDMATLIYTSGTTGEPKGVMLTHANYDACIEMHEERLSMVKDTETVMAFLPMSHILEKAWGYFCLGRGVRMAVNYDPRVIQETIHEVHPNLMATVPRFWEKVYTAVKDKIAGMSKLQRMAVARALKVGKRRNLHYRRLGLKVPALLEKEYQFWDKRIFSKLTKAIGIPEPNMFPTAGAPLSDRICEFFHCVGIEIVIGYGLSETTATVTCFPTKDYQIGTVGTPLPGIDVKVDENGEILVKAPTVTPGYYKNPKANEEAFTPDGWFRTGDAGYFTPEGALVLTERVKDLFKTSNGKYIAPQMLESRLAENKYIDEAAVIGDRRKFVSALLVPNFPNLRAWAENQGLGDEDTDKLLRDPKVIDFMLKQVESVQKGVASYEKIKRITLLPNHFSVMNGEVTNTMKVRRPVVAKRYAKEIEAMYEGT